jgi:endonuclease G
MIAIERNLEWYESSTGYDPHFLGREVPLPTIPESLKSDLVPLRGRDDHELKYTHFSILMRKSRCLSLFTAVNIDGRNLKRLKRSADKWYFDPRIEKCYQCGPELYSGNDLDRGHLVRRLDPVWGMEAKVADEDTFHFCNCAPQHRALNQKTWQQLEDYVLKNAEQHDLRVSVFTGPVFREDDMLYRGKYQIPAEYWKVVAMVKNDGQLSVTAYLQTQKNLLPDLEIEFAYGEYKTYQVPVVKIEALTQLDFGAIRNYDPLGTIEGIMARAIERPEDIML